MPWYTFQISSAQAATVLDQFEQVYVPLGRPTDMALFCRQGPGEDQVTYYLTPATERQAPLLLRIFGAKPGTAPPAHATVVAGVIGKGPGEYK
jgi:hypothetical protein